MDLFDPQPGRSLCEESSFDSSPLRIMMITSLLNVLMIHLSQNNDFLGTCALVPQTFNNDLGRGTRKVGVL